MFQAFATFENVSGFCRGNVTRFNKKKNNIWDIAAKNQSILNIYKELRMIIQLADLRNDGAPIGSRREPAGNNQDRQLKTPYVFEKKSDIF